VVTVAATHTCALRWRTAGRYLNTTNAVTTSRPRASGNCARFQRDRLAAPSPMWSPTQLTMVSPLRRITVARTNSPPTPTRQPRAMSFFFHHGRSSFATS
jgi:hypothetical protein